MVTSKQFKATDELKNQDQSPVKEIFKDTNDIWWQMFSSSFFMFLLENSPNDMITNNVSL